MDLKPIQGLRGCYGELDGLKHPSGCLSRLKRFLSGLKHRGRRRMRSAAAMPIKRWTEMESRWKEKAWEYYRDGLKISDIALLLDVSRQSISACLKSQPGYQEEKKRRKKENARNRRIYKTQKQRTYRAGQGIPMGVTAETMKREHELAVLELSRERYH